jgi:hypothetical protein
MGVSQEHGSDGMLGSAHDNKQGIILMGANCLVRMINEPACKILGYASAVSRLVMESINQGPGTRTAQTACLHHCCDQVYLMCSELYASGDCAMDHAIGWCITLQSELVGKNINVIVPPPFSK